MEKEGKAQDPVETEPPKKEP